MSDNTIKHSSPGNLISLTIDKSYNITDLTIDESLLTKEQKELLEEMLTSSVNEAISKIKELNHSSNDKIKFDAQDLNKVFGDLAKMSSVRFENGKPILSFSLDSISPEIMSKVNSMMDELEKDEEDKRD
ncbi:YbaB/EbfC family DNA-binding protein [Brachyspira aalborgi]|jgi:DNA-binding protein YbaB|uniref:YbaB/EbfC family DNA-binding protein n=1 Tax=Brachyspira aalborgi TaxID=29522 RepID=A0A5C8EG55_9SPIR|nr:YbaB/EbfC family nucleoid-associated protein [Brachyspira aalborgi]TXJ15883.1 YbaB/EbfC family DNA-binding protein [Brachyspira aalborgi]TXJ19383.1 YbaB/EbfC family DNA-binding protein [Brachyspira aalborgi]TXJ20146.1 YbaB/EbfC family DNA-binding protein [Brachyspira aalborgi]TXJ26134.1 YbaB/EbfC family DNA-binding protein [Brachyspira aalborgi]TXJ33416.1 YbaB/EbfC family DNA-binding protein [Brachyspira aalborgi]